MKAEVREKLREALTFDLRWRDSRQLPLSADATTAALDALDALLDDPKLKQPRYYVEQTPSWWNVINSRNRMIEAEFYKGNERAEKYAREHAERLNREES